MMNKEFVMTKLKMTVAAALMSAALNANADIVTSVKPLGFIAAAIADGVTNTAVIVPAGASPHDYHLKPTDVKTLKNADFVLWIGEDVDGFLEKTVDTLDEKKVLEIAELAEIQPLLGKATHHHHEDDHAHKHEHKHSHKHGHKHEHKHDHHHSHKHTNKQEKHDHEEFSTDWHVWYSPQISQVVAGKLAEKLTALFPEKQALIAQNLADFNRTLAAQSEKISAQLAPFANKGFYVFHDAYGYFNDAYGLKQTGAFTINPLVAPGVKTLATIKAEIAEHKVSCLFAEPQFTPKVIETLAKGTGVHIGRLDPMGDKIQLGKTAYVDFLQFTADSYGECLGK